MQLSRFLQILLLRDVLMYLMPGVIFFMLLCVVGLAKPLIGYASFVRVSFGDFLGTSMLLGASYSVGYVIYNSTASAARAILMFREKKGRTPNPAMQKAGDLISAFMPIAEDLELRVANSVGRDVLGEWLPGVHDELSADPRGVRYLRYLCEMMVMIKYPEIHHLTIERRSSLKNFQTSLSGILMASGTIGVAYAMAGLLTRQQGREPSVAAGIIIISLGVLLFLPIEKREQDLRISIWRAFHAMALIEANAAKSMLGRSPKSGDALAEELKNELDMET